MLDRDLRALARDIEDVVEMPALTGIVDRGASLRRRRRGAAVAVAASCLVAAGLLTTLHQDPVAEPPPAIEPDSSVPDYPGGGHTPDLEEGTYAIRLGTDRGDVTAEVTVPQGWTGWVGPNRSFRDGYVSLLVQDVAYVADLPQEPCGLGTAGMSEVGDTPADLVRAFTRIPHHELVDGPEPDSRFGVPATHLVLQATDRVRCPGKLTFGLWSVGEQFPIYSLGPGTRLELWVLDVNGEAVLVAATSVPGTPTRGLRELADVADSVEIVR
ncbi:MAG: hypothetical protein ACXWDM_04745 [Nocardioides sp.]